MAKVKIQGNASGTGVLTVTAPNTSTDRTITLPDGDVTLGAATPSIDDNGNATAITIDSSENVGIGTTTPAQKLSLNTGYVQVGNGIGGGGGVKYPYSAANADCRNWRTRSDMQEYGDWGIEQSTTQSGESYSHKFKITQAGDVNINTGDLFFGTAGKGIVLGSTTNVAANTLDDYEEGTWTPTVANGTIGAASGEYTKIGNFCIATFTLKDFSNKTTTNSIAIRSIPFTQDGTATVGTVIAYQNGQSNPLNLIKGASFDEFNMFYMYNASGWGTQQHNTLGGDPHFYCVVTYKTT